jgi:EamA-like transporter family.
MDKGSLKGHLALAVAYSIFGINIVTTKDIANSGIVSPIALFSMRAFGASILFWFISLFQPKEKVERKDLAKTIIASFFGLFVTQFTFLLAIRIATPLDTAIVSTLGPIFTMFFAFLFIKEPITGKKALGVGISFFGIIFLILNSVHATNGIEATKPLGFILLFLNALSFSLYLGAFRPLTQKYSVVTFMKWMFLFSLLMSLPLSAGDLLNTEYSLITTRILSEILFLVVFATFISYFLIPYGQKSVRPTIVSMYAYVQPIIAAAISIATGMDIMTWKKGLAIVLVFAEWE